MRTSPLVRVRTIPNPCFTPGPRLAHPPSFHVRPRRALHQTWPRSSRLILCAAQLPNTAPSLSRPTRLRSSPKFTSSVVPCVALRRVCCPSFVHVPVVLFSAGSLCDPVKHTSSSYGRPSGSCSASPPHFVHGFPTHLLPHVRGRLRRASLRSLGVRVHCRTLTVSSVGPSFLVRPQYSPPPTCCCLATPRTLPPSSVHGAAARFVGPFGVRPCFGTLLSLSVFPRRNIRVPAAHSPAPPCTAPLATSPFVPSTAAPHASYLC